ncbi:hypothetical protein [uncultured Polaribacter sp.]|uniref:hypothetical protein n=1 Tax=uncultured Polaribacter sp. TaxID=174711 RepID=UPI0026303876|nr:hypothetical protein [uncultured Polaribacter sp.]
MIQVFALVIYYFSLGFDSSFLDIFIIFRDVTSDGSNGTQEVTKNFIDNHIIKFFIYSFVVSTFSALTGFISSRLIRFQNWDKKFKLFRFKNQWYYIFSGEVLNMKKFEEAHKVSLKGNKGKDQNILMTYADILVSVSDQNDQKELYTGYVVDYDLKSDDITQLDKVYLIDTHRYKRKEKILNNQGIEIKDEQSTQEEKPIKSRNRLKVPGDIFILKASKIINMNLTYIPSKNKKMENEVKKQRMYGKVQLVFFVSIVLLILIHFFDKALGLDDSKLSNYFLYAGFWGKFLTILLINQFLSLFIPIENKEKKLSYDFNKFFFLRLLILFILGLLTFISLSDTVLEL